MFAWRSWQVLRSAALLSAVGWSQTAPQVAPVPSDPLELVTSAPQTVNTPDGRAALLALLERSRQNFIVNPNVSPPYTLKVSLTAGGPVQFTGAGEMIETRLRTQTRWSARLGSYSLTRVFAGPAFDSGSGGPIPIRLQMVRSAIIWPVHNATAAAALRTTNATWNGKSVTCLLLFGGATTAPGRDWRETEYCIDPQSGLLQTYSEAPGIYTIYDYGNATQFHGRILPGQFTVSEAGSVVLQATVSIQDPAADEPAFIPPTPQMLSPGLTLVPPSNMFQPAGLAQLNTPAQGGIHPVVVHATVMQDGHVAEAEALQTSDPARSQAAVNLVKNSTYRPEKSVVQREIFFRVQ